MSSSDLPPFHIKQPQTSDTQMKTNIIQWNINGFFSRLEELQILTKELNPTIICLQETNFNEKSNILHSDTMISINVIASRVLEPVVASL